MEPGLLKEDLESRANPASCRSCLNAVFVKLAGQVLSKKRYLSGERVAPVTGKEEGRSVEGRKGRGSKASGSAGARRAESSARVLGSPPFSGLLPGSPGPELAVRPRLQTRVCQRASAAREGTEPYRDPSWSRRRGKAAQNLVACPPATRRDIRQRQGVQTDSPFAIGPRRGACPADPGPPRGPQRLTTPPPPPPASGTDAKPTPGKAQARSPGPKGAASGPFADSGCPSRPPVPFHPLPESSVNGASRGSSSGERAEGPRSGGSGRWRAPGPPALHAWGFRGLPSWSQGRQSREPLSSNASRFPKLFIRVS
nr:uncharacterized protein LOC110551453 [Meriones unguiculatus]